MKPPMMVQTIEHCAKCGCDYAVMTALDEQLLAFQRDPRKYAETEHAATVKIAADDHAHHTQPLDATRWVTE